MKRSFLLVVLFLCSACTSAVDCDPSKLAGTYELREAGHVLIIELQPNGVAKVGASAQLLEEASWEYSAASNQVFISGNANIIKLLQDASKSPSPPAEALRTQNSTHALSIRCGGDGQSQYLFGDDDARVRFEKK